MGQIENVMNNVDRAAVNPEEGELGIWADK
jgi:hypothetical protein